MPWVAIMVGVAFLVGRHTRFGKDDTPSIYFRFSEQETPKNGEEKDKGEESA